MSDPNGGSGFAGYQDPGSLGHFNAQTFIVQSILSRIRTATLVEVKSVTNAGGVSPVGFVDISPLVNQADGAGNAVSHETIYHCPYFRVQGGANAVILDPEIGDIGVAVFADRDISSVSANKARANPGSWRRFDMADALYIGGLLNGAPTQYVQFLPGGGGINVVSPLKVKIKAPSIFLDGPVECSSTVTAQGEGTFNGGHTVSVHTHPDPQGGSTGSPTG